MGMFLDTCTLKPKVDWTTGREGKEPLSGQVFQQAARPSVAGTSNFHWQVFLQSRVAALHERDVVPYLHRSSLESWSYDGC